MVNHPNRGRVARFNVTEYTPTGKVSGVVWAPSAREAVIRLASIRSVEVQKKGEDGLASLTALGPPHGHGEAWTDNAHGQYDADGLHGLYARRLKP